jgi:hypothetical protein
MLDRSAICVDCRSCEFQVELRVRVFWSYSELCRVPVWELVPPSRPLQDASRYPEGA